MFLSGMMIEMRDDDDGDDGGGANDDRGSQRRARRTGSVCYVLVSVLFDSIA